MDSTDKILLKRHLQQNGEAQVRFTKEVAKQCDNYVPYDKGRLKNMSIELYADKIIYNAPYAKKQYYTNKGGNKGALRGKLWDKRMWADRGKEIVQIIASFVGGKI